MFLFNSLRMVFVLRILLGILVITSVKNANADENIAKGEKLAKKHCARCHVVGNFNKFGGIGSTPSFQLIMGMKDGIERFETFFERRPHPVFVRVPSVPKWSEVPSYATEFTVTARSLDQLLSFVKTIKKKDLSKVPVTKRFRPGQKLIE